MKGKNSKEIVTQKILEAFDQSFRYDKEIRIPLVEDGELIQIKCTLTCAKANVDPNGDTAIPGETQVSNNSSSIKNDENKIIEPTAEEKENVQRLAEILGL